MRTVSAELDESRRAVLRSERLVAVGELAAGIAHEIRNPLTSVKLLLQNAARNPGDTRLSELEARVVLEEVYRMERTIEQLLDYARALSGQRQRHDFRVTLQRALNLVQGRARQQNVRIESTISSRPLPVDGDPDQLHQVCVNLLINGIEVMQRGGVLRIDADLVPGNRGIRVRFRDFGPGISEELLQRMFEPFVSAKPGGTGLGLAISRRIVNQHGGSLVAENHLEGGASLILSLPPIVEDGTRAAPPAIEQHAVALR
jgi:signal transduction histidine kinase